MANSRSWLFDATAAGGDLAFYPEHKRWIATGPAGALGGGGWSISTWAVVLGVSIAKSGGTFEAQTAAPLGGNIPQLLSVSTRAVDHSYVGTWTNETAAYTIDVEGQKKVAGVWTADFTENRPAASTFSSRHFYVGGDNVRFRVRYNNAGTLGDWSGWSQGIIPA